MSFDALELLIDPAVRLVGSLALDAAELGLGLELELALGLELELELVVLLAPPIFAFFNTKPLAAPAPLDGLALLLALLSRCRQPVAVVCPAISLDERPVGWLLCGPGLCGLGVCGLEL